MTKDDIYNNLIEKSTQGEIVDRMKNMADSAEKYKAAFHAARAFIDIYCEVPDLTLERVRKYDLYIASARVIAHKEDR